MCWLLVIVGVLDWESVGVARKNEKWTKKPEQKNKALEVYPRFCLFFFFEKEKREENQSAARFEEKASLERQHNINERSVRERKENVYKNRSYIRRRRDAIEKSWQEEKVAAMNAKSRVIRKSIWYAVRFATYWVLDTLPWRCTAPSRHTHTNTPSTEKVIISETNSYLYYLPIVEWRGHFSRLIRFLPHSFQSFCARYLEFVCSYFAEWIKFSCRFAVDSFVVVGSCVRWNDGFDVRAESQCRNPTNTFATRSLHTHTHTFEPRPKEMYCPQA